MLFWSLPSVAADHGLGIILTGMGQDGAAGLVAMREASAYTIAQDEKSSVIFGMPRTAIELGGATEILPLRQIGQKVLTYLNTVVPAVN